MIWTQHASWTPKLKTVSAMFASTAIPSAQLKGTRKRLRIRPGVFDFEPGQTKPKISGTVLTNRHTTIPNDSEPILAFFKDDPKNVRWLSRVPGKETGLVSSRLGAADFPDAEMKWGTEACIV